MALTETDLLRLIVAIYEAASEPAAWPFFLEQCAQAMAGDVALLHKHYLEQHRSEVIASFGLASAFRASYHEHYSRINVWREHGKHLYQTGSVLHDAQIYPRSLFLRTEFYHDYMRPMGAVKSLAGVVSRQRNDVLNLTILRREQSPEWTDAEGGTIKLLLPHVAQALLVNQRLALLEAGEAVLDTLLLGVSFLSESGRVVSSNQAAERMVRSDDGLSLRHGTLGAVDRVADAALQRAIRQAALPEDSLDVSGPVVVPRPSMRRPYVVRIGSLRRKLRQFVGTEAPVVVALITDPEEQRPLPADLLMKSFQLTAREAALAVKLAEGCTVEQAAEELQIRYETARTHLRRIFDKTNTNRQTDLVLLLGRLSPQASGS